jgi:hypothetical protein
MALPGDGDHSGDVGNIFVDGLDIKPFALGLSPPPQVDRIDGEALGRELLRRPGILAAVRIDPVADGDDRAGLALGQERRWISSPPRLLKDSSCIDVTPQFGLRAIPRVTAFNCVDESNALSASLQSL